MAEFRGIQTSLFLILMLQFTEAATEQRLTVRDGDEVTLPCNSVTEDQNNCDSIVWLFTYLRSRPPVVLVRNGKIEKAKAESDRLSVLQNCSLVMKKVTRGDVGLYVCRQSRSGRRHKDAEVHLSVVSMTEETNRDEVTLRCSVWTYERCPRTVKWMNGGQDVDKDKEVKTSRNSCFASLSFKTSHFFYTSSFTSLKCEVTDGDKVMQFSPSGDKTGEDTTTTTTTTEEDTKGGDTTKTSIITCLCLHVCNTISFHLHRTQNICIVFAVWVYVLSAVVLVVLLIIIVFVVKWKINKGNTTQTNNNDVPTAPPAAEAPLTDVSMSLSGHVVSSVQAGPEDGVSYATISYTQKADSKAQGRSNHGDDAVTYSTVKASSADPSNVYASIT
uniref:uncharacterized protein LOC120808265 isoform X1 n=1 Tax=Gasterosteus aculeatus aculeatus TaxID=481459 RepID=UPI001A98C69E|nr:uncharacterized protein LOC120808265 isoform X1 [Gasterosteus aculeatus aculeatus]